MGLLAALVHLANFFAPALVVGCLAAGLAKALWRRELTTVRWRVLAAWACGASALASAASLAISGHDGRMAGYGGMIVACATTLWWRAFVRRR